MGDIAAFEQDNGCHVLHHLVCRLVWTDSAIGRYRLGKCLHDKHLRQSTDGGSTREYTQSDPNIHTP